MLLLEQMSEKKYVTHPELNTELEKLEQRVLGKAEQMVNAAIVKQEGKFAQTLQQVRQSMDRMVLQSNETKSTVDDLNGKMEGYVNRTSDTRDMAVQAIHNAEMARISTEGLDERVTLILDGQRQRIEQGDKLERTVDEIKALLLSHEVVVNRFKTYETVAVRAVKITSTVPFLAVGQRIASFIMKLLRSLFFVVLGGVLVAGLSIAFMHIVYF